MRAIATATATATANALTHARLPRWSLPSDWPQVNGHPALADITWAAGRITAVAPSGEPPGHAVDLRGAPLLPGFVDAHTHIDKTFTLGRIADVKPGLLGAIEAMMKDRQAWTFDDIRARAGRAIAWAHEAGVTRLRSHVDWWEPERTPLAWPVLKELSEEWSGRLAVERVSLIPLHLYVDKSQAMAMARTVASSGPGALLGGFVHSTNWNPDALRNLFEAAQAFDLDVDLHMDEELNPAATGLAETARLLRAMGFVGRVVCGHNCALAAQDDSVALATLDAVARAPITMISLPITNLLLQDARTGRTPRQRGLTLLKEARERGIPLLIASDNVQDPFCAVGSYDPVEALAAGVLAGQLTGTGTGDGAFDRWSEALCRADWLSREPASAWNWVGAKADLVAFTAANVEGWPSRSQARFVWRDGEPISGELPAAWKAT